jgi:fumarylacetoacetase
MSLGKEAWHEARVTIQKLFSKGDTTLMEIAFKDTFTYDFKSVKMCMPVDIREYTDFYSSKNHAYNVGVMFRGPDNALQPNWLHLPIGYHGRASTVVISGTDIIRPKGQVSADQKTPSWSQCQRLDFELEMGAVLGKGSKLG